MTALSASGALLGLTAGLGGWLALARLPARRAPTLEDRLAPYLRGVLVPAGRPTRSRLEALFEPVMVDAVRWVERISGGSGSVLRRLDQLGGDRSLEQFRAEQVLWGVLGAFVGAGLGLLAALANGFSVVPLVGLIVVGTLLGVLGRDQLLTLRVRRREARMLAEFPAVAELLALAIGAGEGPVGALDRVVRTCRGELTGELRRALAQARTGASFVEAMEALAARSTLPSVARFVDGVAVAVDRGTPLAAVLRAQAQDVRELSRRRLMEAGGRKEIGMMVPVVFLLLPVTVLFAVYPGLAVLDLSL